MDAATVDALTITFLIVSTVLVVGLIVAMWRMRHRVARTPEEIVERDAQARAADQDKTDLLERRDRYNLPR